MQENATLVAYVSVAKLLHFLLAAYALMQLHCIGCVCQCRQTASFPTCRIRLIAVAPSQLALRAHAGLRPAALRAQATATAAKYAPSDGSLARFALH